VDLRDLPLRKVYSTDSDNVLYDFYIPALEVSVEYCRLAGFFSSTSLAVAATGILGLIKNDGLMRMVVSPRLSKEDVDTIISSQEEPTRFIERRMLEDLDHLEDEFTKDHIFALGWMIANQRLKIKVAIALDTEGRIIAEEELPQAGLFHPKVGILRDSKGNTVSFSGSLNETRAAWLDNIEEFKVFRSWDPAEEQYLSNDIANFDRFWNDCAPRTKVIDVPVAVERKLVQMAPKEFNPLHVGRWYKPKEQSIQLFGYQKDAIKEWFAKGNRGIFAMATGTGKTFTALGCLDRLLKATDKLATIIACPQAHLVQQWQGQLVKFGIKSDGLIVADQTNKRWRTQLSNFLADIEIGYKDNLIIITTHKTLSSKDFKHIIQQNVANIKACLIADEVHGLGSTDFRTGLLPQYGFRLGLSATPKRWFDDIGTKVIEDYFGGIIARFELERAINTINPRTNETYLTPYRYLPKFVTLSSEELELYVEKTKTISVRYARARNAEEKDRYLESLIFERANIIKNAIAKYQAFEEILDSLGSSLKWTITFCSPQQIDKAMRIISQRSIVTHRFTMEEDAMPSNEYAGMTEREHILEKFAEGKYQVLTAMVCLNEGVDVPQARTAILMASSGNPREYIQRIGRVIRRFPGKDEAAIYDIVVIPSFDKLPPELRKIEWTLFQKEVFRYEEIARIAANRTQALELIYRIKEEYRSYID